MSEAEIFLPVLAGGLGPGLGRKYAYLVLPTVLMPRGGFPHFLGSAGEEFSRPISRLVVWGESTLTSSYQLC